MLCVTLKRFRYDSDQGALKKIGDPLEFPVDLDMAKCAPGATPADEGDAQTQAQAQSQTQYLLNSVVVHEGTATFGHYTCYARPDPSKRPDYWLLFNDHSVSEVSYDQVCQASFGSARGSSSAYLLFYSKR
jgi:ubiquitin C-terminal hydrolase